MNRNQVKLAQIRETHCRKERVGERDRDREKVKKERGEINKSVKEKEGERSAKE